MGALVVHVGIAHVTRRTDVDDTHFQRGICRTGSFFCSLRKGEGRNQQQDQQKNNTFFHDSLLKKDCVMALIVLEEPQLFQIIRDVFPAVKTFF